MNSILIVDDEQNILHALKRVFYKTDYQVFYANSGKEALNIFKVNKIDVIVSDVRMPIMDGIEVLTQVKVLNPETIRIFLSGYTEADQILSAMYENIAQAFVYKPWDNAELLNMIECVIAMRDELKSVKMYNCIQRLEQIPTLSNYYFRIEQALKNEEDISVIASYIEEDPALVMRLLKLANSAYYGRKVVSVDKAIILVGGDMLKKIVLTQRIFKNCDDNDLTNVLWRHILKTIQTMGIMKNLVDIKDEELLLTMCVLHTIGIIFFTSQDKNTVLKVVSGDLDEPIEQRFENEFGLSHAMVGSYLLHWWQMPLVIYECARHYITPSKASKVNSFYITLVHIASHYAWRAIDYESLNHNLDMEAISYHNIDIDAIGKCIVEKLIDKER